jgi:hypothetical protein
VHGKGKMPLQVSFTVPVHLEKFWHLEAILGMQVIAAARLEEV